MSSGVSSPIPSERRQVPVLRPLHCCRQGGGRTPPQLPDGQAPQDLAAWSQKLGERLRPTVPTRHEPVQPQGAAAQARGKAPSEACWEAGPSLMGGSAGISPSLPCLPAWPGPLWPGSPLPSTPQAIWSEPTPHPHPVRASLAL